jgi:hypothetical protein
MANKLDAMVMMLFKSLAGCRDGLCNEVVYLEPLVKEVRGRVEDRLYIPPLDHIPLKECGSKGCVKQVLKEKLSSNLLPYWGRNHYINKLIDGNIKKSYLYDNHPSEIELDLSDNNRPFKYVCNQTVEQTEQLVKAAIIGAIVIVEACFNNNQSKHVQSIAEKLNSVYRNLRSSSFRLGFCPTALSDLRIMTHEEHKLYLGLQKALITINPDVNRKSDPRHKLMAVKVSRTLRRINKIRQTNPLVRIDKRFSSSIWMGQPLNVVQPTTWNRYNEFLWDLKRYKKQDLLAEYNLILRAFRCDTSDQPESGRDLRDSTDLIKTCASDAGTVVAKMFNKIETLEKKFAQDYPNADGLRKKYATFKKEIRIARINPSSDLYAAEYNRRFNTEDIKIINRINEIHKEMRLLEEAVDILNSFVEKTKAKYKSRIKEIKGKEIISSYFERNYSDEANTTGSIHSSCMRYNNNKCIATYANNPQCCSLIVVREGNKTVGRAVLWTAITGKKYVDRIFASTEKVVNEIRGYCMLKGYKTIWRNEGGAKQATEVVEVALNKVGAKGKMPYFDSMRKVDPRNFHFYGMNNTSNEISQFIDYANIHEQGPKNRRNRIYCIGGDCTELRNTFRLYNGDYMTRSSRDMNKFHACKLVWYKMYEHYFQPITSEVFVTEPAEDKNVGLYSFRNNGSHNNQCVLKKDIIEYEYLDHKFWSIGNKELLEEKIREGRIGEIFQQQFILARMNNLHRMKYNDCESITEFITKIATALTMDDEQPVEGKLSWAQFLEKYDYTRSHGAMGYRRHFQGSTTNGIDFEVSSSSSFRTTDRNGRAHKLYLGTLLAIHSKKGPRVTIAEFIENLYNEYKEYSTRTSNQSAVDTDSELGGDSDAKLPETVHIGDTTTIFD